MNWIRERREELNMSQDDLAQQLQLAGIEVDRSAIGHWENGRRKPRLQDTEFRRALARVLKIREAELLARAGYQTSIKHSDEAEQAALLVDKLPPEMRQFALKMLKAIEN